MLDYIAKKLSKQSLIVGGTALLVLITVTVTGVYAYPQNHWVIRNGDQLEILRDHVCFLEGQGERDTYKDVYFSKDVLSAEVFLSGFNIWYTRSGPEHEVAQLQVDSWVDGIIRLNRSQPQILTQSSRYAYRLALKHAATLL